LIIVDILTLVKWGMVF